MGKSRLILAAMVFGLVLIFGLSGCATPSAPVPSAKSVSGIEARTLEKGVEPAASEMGFWPLFQVKTEVYPLLDAGEPIGIERKRTVTVLFSLFGWDSTSQERLPTE
jgi:hypothetical protein